MECGPPGVGMVWSQQEDSGIGHCSSFEVMEDVQTLCVLEPHARLVVALSVDQGREEGEGLRVST